MTARTLRACQASQALPTHFSPRPVTPDLPRPPATLGPSRCSRPHVATGWVDLTIAFTIRAAQIARLFRHECNSELAQRPRYSFGE